MSLFDNLLTLVNNQPGGLPGLIEKFQQGGLGDVAASWISTGQNLPISASQIQSVLGSGLVQQLASQLGVSPESASSTLAGSLPGLIDQLTPNGQLPTGDIASQGLNLLKGFLDR